MGASKENKYYFASGCLFLQKYDMICWQLNNESCIRVTFCIAT